MSDNNIDPLTNSQFWVNPSNESGKTESSKPKQQPSTSNTSTKPQALFDEEYRGIVYAQNPSTNQRTMQDPLSKSAYFGSDPLSDPLTKSTTKLLSVSENPTKITSTIRSFFGSTPLPTEKKITNFNDIPPGIDGISFILKWGCFSAGIEAMNQSIKKAQSSEEKLLYRFFKIYFLIRMRLYDKANSEFGTIAPIDKIVTQDPSNDGVNLPYHIRLIHALNPYISKVSEERTLERLYLLLEYCKVFIKTKEKEPFEYEEDRIDVESICDINLSVQRWKSRCLYLSTLIVELHLEKYEMNTVISFIERIKKILGDHPVLSCYMGRCCLMKGDDKQAEQILNTNEEQEGTSPTKNQFNRSVQETREGKIDEARKDLVLINSRTQELQVTCNNNLAYLLSAEGDVKSAIELLENTIRASNLTVRLSFY